MSDKKTISGGSIPWPWIKPQFDPGDAHPWKAFGFAGFSSQSEGWYAWLNKMPSGPNTFHVVGDVLVSNPGVTALLTMREPQGINPNILMLDLTLVQQPGVWPDLIAHVQAHFDRVTPSGSSKYSSVDIFLGSTNKIVTIDHIEVVS